MSATSSAPCSPPTATREACSTSARARRRACSSCTVCARRSPASTPAQPAPVRKALAQQHAPPPKATHTRAQTKVLVLNGNGRTGVAHEEAAKLQSLGYDIAGAADAHRHDYATSLVMYRPGYRPEGVRLAHDLHVSVVGPLDGVSVSALHGGQLAVILGAR